MSDLKTENRTESEQEAGVPHWVKVFGYAALALFVLVLLHLFFGGGAAMHG
jgi:hypothetical protein